MHRVSVIIPAYNRANLIGETIQSVLDQTFTDFEIIVVDDGSTDNTREVIDSFKDPRISYKYQENRGVAAARNTGIRFSGGEYIAFLDSDDLWLPQNLELKVKLLDACPDTALVFSDYYAFDGDTGATVGTHWQNRPYRYLLESEERIRRPFKATLPFVTLMNPVAVMVRSYVFNEVGYFDESLRGTDDWDMWIRIFQRFLIGAINTPLARFRYHDSRFTTANIAGMYRAEIAMLDKVSRNYSFSREEMKFFRRKLARTHYEYGWDRIINNKEADLGRKKLFTAITVNPWCVRPYMCLALSLLGSRGVITAKLCMERLQSLFLHH